VTAVSPAAFARTRPRTRPQPPQRLLASGAAASRFRPDFNDRIAEGRVRPGADRARAGSARQSSGAAPCCRR
jgi:hypothetical protein